MSIRCVVIDKVRTNLTQISGFIQRFPVLKLVNLFIDKVSAEAYILNNKIDLVFIDAENADKVWIDRISESSNMVMVIPLFENDTPKEPDNSHNVLDYLVKPIEFTRFKKRGQPRNRISPEYKVAKKAG